MSSATIVGDSEGGRVGVGGGGKGVSVGGLDVGVFKIGKAVFVGSRGRGVAVGSGVNVEDAKLVGVGNGVSVGFAVKALQEVKIMARNERIIALYLLFKISPSL